MLLPIPYLLEQPLGEAKRETREAARRFIVAPPSSLAGLADHVPAGVSGGDDDANVTPGISARQARYDRYFAVARTAAAPSDTLIRATLAAVGEVARNAASGHSLAAVEEHL